jgi:hypothetical protein
MFNEGSILFQKIQSYSILMSEILVDVPMKVNKPFTVKSRTNEVFKKVFCKQLDNSNQTFLKYTIIQHNRRTFVSMDTGYCAVFRYSTEQYMKPEAILIQYLDTI